MGFQQGPRTSLHGELRRPTVEETLRVLIDTNILAHIFAKGSGRLSFRARTLLIRELLGRNDSIIVVCEEQAEYEIRRALDNIIVTGAITVEPKLEAIRNVYRDLINSCVEFGKCKVVKRQEGRITRAASLNRQLEVCRLRLRGNIGSDLILIAAEEQGAVILASDVATMYRAYRECLLKRARIPSMYLLKVDENTKTLRYRVCGQNHTLARRGSQQYSQNTRHKPRYNNTSR